jgi:hypothetical protein
MVRLDEFAPCTIAQSGDSLGRADQVGEEDSRENALELRFFLEQCEKPLKLLQHACPIPRERGVFFAG